MTHSLRPYQSAAIQGIYNYFQDDTGNPLVVIPTAGGKSLVAATFIEGVLKAFPDQRILIVTHVRELIEQNYAELMKLWPQAPAGIYSAGLKKREIRAQILFAGIQSIHRKVYDVQQCDLVLIDEAHLIPRTSNTMATEPEGRIAAIVDFTFNLGAGRLQTSTLRRRINQQDWSSAATELGRWVHGGSRVLPGLVSRRKAEIELLAQDF